VTLEAKRYIEERTPLRPAVGVVLGSGLGAFAEELTERTDIPYGEIPGWPGSTAVGHAGKLTIGKLGELVVAVMAGRAHLYEGYSPAQVTYGVRVLGAIGVRSMVFTNAAGGINLELERGGHARGAASYHDRVERQLLHSRPFSAKEPRPCLVISSQPIPVSRISILRIL